MEYEMSKKKTIIRSYSLMSFFIIEVCCLGSRGGPKSTLSCQSDSQRDVVYVDFLAGGEIRKTKGRQRKAACACYSTIYSAVECSCRQRVFFF